MNRLFSLDKKVLFALAALATLLLFIISPDSYTHDLYARYDSAWFFMCGKAWMEGLTPYVDFADSKGPLLWLIYGIGYLISPYNYIGVFWLSCLWYSIIFYITYLTARIFLSGRRQAVVCAVLMALAYFNPKFHYETRAEDWCMLFMVLSFYLVCRLLYTDTLDQRGRHWVFFILGACFGLMVMIKFNVAAMQSVFILFAAYHTIRHRQGVIWPALLVLLGIFVACIPFVLYLMYRGCFQAFIQEYFINTFHTTSSKQGFLSQMVYYWKIVFTFPMRIPFFLLLVVSCILIGFKLEKYKAFPIISTMFIYNLTIMHAYWDYYFSSCAICCFWAVVYILKVLPRYTARIKPLPAALCVIAILTAFQIVMARQGKYNLFWNDGASRASSYTAEYYISQIPHPTIINASSHEEGHGILSKALPGTKYWSKQNDSLEDMDKSHIEGIKSLSSDFIIKNWCHVELFDDDFILSSGYPYRYAKYVFSKKKLKAPAKPIHVTNWEVLTKQRPKALQQ